jgi:hypothetical protein
VIEVDERQLMALTPHDIVEGFAAIRDNEPVVGIGWEEARACVDAEERWLGRASQAADPAASAV